MLTQPVVIPIFEIPDRYSEAINKYSQLVSIYNFIRLSGRITDEERLTAALFRVHYATALEGIDYNFELVKQIVSNKRAPLERFEQEIYGYYQAELFLYKRISQPLDIHTVHDMQRLFFAYPEANKPLDLFTSRLYEFRGADLAGLFNYGIAALLEWMNEDNTTPELIKAIIIHGYIAASGPFGQANPKIGRILQFNWLLRHNLTLGGLIIPEKELFNDRKNYQEQIIKLKKNIEASPEGQINFTEFIQFVIGIYIKNAEDVKVRLRTHYRKKCGFDELQPRLKNIVNYIFELGYLLSVPESNSLNERQKNILNDLYKTGFLQTKDLFSRYEVNRKTIQRDFAGLEEAGWVRVLGEGRGLKYAIPVSPGLPQKIQQFQSRFDRL